MNNAGVQLLCGGEGSEAASEKVRKACGGGEHNENGAGRGQSHGEAGKEI